MMKLDDLIEMLEGIRDEHGGDLKVVVALQPNYPMRGDLLNVCLEKSKNRVWLAMSDNRDYGVPEGVWEDDEVFEDEEDED